MTNEDLQDNSADELVALRDGTDTGTQAYNAPRANDNNYNNRMTTNENNIDMDKGRIVLYIGICIQYSTSNGLPFYVLMTKYAKRPENGNIHVSLNFMSPAYH